MEFITTGNRIAVENFDIGKIYTITWQTGNYKSLACTGKGTDFVMFQDQEPELLFCLTMDSAITVSSIDEGGGGAGTMNYNELENKPSINGFVLVGNKTGADLGLASQSDLEDYATNASVVAGLATKQDALSSSQLAAVNSGITSELVTQIRTNQNNISKIHNPAELYFSETEPTGTIPLQSYWISSTGVHVYGDNVYGAILEQGSFETFSGAEITANNRVRTTFDSQAPTGTYTVTAEGADDVVIYAYTNNNTSSWSSADSVTAWQPMPYTFTTSQNLYLRFAFRHRDNTAIAPSDVSNVKVISHSWTT